MFGLGDDALIFMAAMGLCAVFGAAVLRNEAEPGSKKRSIASAVMVAPFALAAVLFAWAVVQILMSPRVQTYSQHATQSHCIGNDFLAERPFIARNACDTTIIVGLCLPDKMNPDTCAQTVLLEPGESATLESRYAERAVNPTNREGFTVVACTPGDRPSRGRDSTMMMNVGICLPPR